jgi:hypothetical protein
MICHIYKTIKSQKDCDSLQEDLDASARWESDWLMAFHPDKCSVLTITNKKNPVKHNYLLHNHTLELVSSAKMTLHPEPLFVYGSIL